MIGHQEFDTTDMVWPQQDMTHVSRAQGLRIIPTVGLGCIAVGLCASSTTESLAEHTQ